MKAKQPFLNQENENLLNHEMLYKYYRQSFLDHFLFQLQLKNQKFHQVLQVKGLNLRVIHALSDQSKRLQTYQIQYYLPLHKTFQQTKVIVQFLF